MVLVTAQRDSLNQ